jgi:hypothetical protein
MHYDSHRFRMAWDVAWEELWVEAPRGQLEQQSGKAIAVLADWLKEAMEHDAELVGTDFVGLGFPYVDV